MTTERPRYFAYLLRLWRVRTDGEAVWRASIEDPHTGERHSFATPEGLFEFLMEQLHDATRNSNECGASSAPD